MVYRLSVEFVIEVSVENVCISALIQSNYLFFFFFGTFCLFFCCERRRVVSDNPGCVIQHFFPLLYCMSVSLSSLTLWAVLGTFSPIHFISKCAFGEILAIIFFSTKVQNIICNAY